MALTYDQAGITYDNAGYTYDGTVPVVIPDVHATSRPVIDGGFSSRTQTLTPASSTPGVNN